jgi:hypothetical protein
MLHACMASINLADRLAILPFIACSSKASCSCPLQLVSPAACCLNPYIACRKDAFGVSDVIVQSSIVTGSEIGQLVTAQSLKKGEREPMRNYIPRSYNLRPNCTY